MQPSAAQQSTLVIWRLLDNKPGHAHQSLGLVNAIAAHTATQVFDIPVTRTGDGWLAWLTGVFPAGQTLPPPDLIVGAGHQTHLPMLAAKKAYGGKTICLMQPTLPVFCFDVCLIPEHDRYQGWGNFIETRGVLNHLNAHAQQPRDPQKTIVMIGGPSKHYAWDSSEVVAQIYALVTSQPMQQFVLTTSRRTPVDFLNAVRRVYVDNLRIVPHKQTDADWVARELAHASTAWVTEDSVSMVYEALTAQVAVGVIQVKATPHSRVARGIERLLQKGLVVRFDVAGAYQQALRPVHQFNEAQRCSRLLLDYLWSTTANPAGRLAHKLI